MLCSDNNIRYLIGYYQPAMIAQHASRATARKLAVDLMMATLIGATAGLAMWWLMKLWPSWFWFVLMMALFSFLFATRIFADGARAADAELLPVELWACRRWSSSSFPTR